MDINVLYNSQVYDYVFMLCFKFKLNVVQILTRILPCLTLHILFDSPRMFRLTEVWGVFLFLVLWAGCWEAYFLTFYFFCLLISFLWLSLLTNSSGLIKDKTPLLTEPLPHPHLAKRFESPCFSRLVALLCHLSPYPYSGPSPSWDIDSATSWFLGPQPSPLSPWI